MHTNLNNVIINSYQNIINNNNNNNNPTAANSLGNFINTTINMSQSSSTPVKRLVAFIWHPREPFCISVQRTTDHTYTVNFHILKK